MADLQQGDQVTVQISGKVIDVFPNGETLIEIPSGRPMRVSASPSTIYVVVDTKDLTKE